MHNLDAQELLHLAMYAASKDNHDDALGYIKQAQKQEPDNANITLMLAAEYAEIGMYDRAIEMFDMAVELDGELKVAQLQVGLLLITLNRLEEAKLRLVDLEALGEDDCFGAFALGLHELVDDNPINAKKLLEKGCVINQENLPLNDDIQRIINNLNEQLGSSSEIDKTDENQNESNEFLLSTYNNQ
jgi:tetratricopeptide (TPR) repeat protein